MKFEFDDVRFLKVVAKPYEVAGKTGVSYRANLLVEGELYICKTSKEFYESFKDVKDKVGTAGFKLSSFDRKLDLYVESFV